MKNKSRNRGIHTAQRHTANNISSTDDFIEEKVNIIH